MNPVQLSNGARWAPPTDPSGSDCGALILPAGYFSKRTGAVRAVITVTRAVPEDLMGDPLKVYARSVREASGRVRACPAVYLIGLHLNLERPEPQGVSINGRTYTHWMQFRARWYPDLGDFTDGNRRRGPGEPEGAPLPEEREPDAQISYGFGRATVRYHVPAEHDDACGYLSEDRPTDAARAVLRELADVLRGRFLELTVEAPGVGCWMIERADAERLERIKANAAQLQELADAWTEAGEVGIGGAR